MAYKKHKQYRLPGFDYSSNAAYFITIVTKNREHFFGEIKEGEMFLSEIGKYIEDNFKIIESTISHIQIEEYAIMPNHLHLIVTIITESNSNFEFKKGIQPLLPKSISSFINHLKGNIKFWCISNNLSQFAWQPRFHDRIIRNEKEYTAISKYIENNVANWQHDEYL